jgi:hypothetical protein
MILSLDSVVLADMLLIISVTIFIFIFIFIITVTGIIRFFLKCFVQIPVREFSLAL